MQLFLPAPAAFRHSRAPRCAFTHGYLCKKGPLRLKLLKFHLRVAVVGHSSPPRLVLLREDLDTAHAHLLKVVGQLFLLQGVQAAVQAVLLARQHFPVFGSHAVVVIIIHLVVVRRDSVLVHEADCVAREVGSECWSRARRAVFQCCGLGGASAGISSLLIFEKAKGNHTKLCFCERNPPQQKSTSE